MQFRILTNGKRYRIQQAEISFFKWILKWKTLVIEHIGPCPNEYCVEYIEFDSLEKAENWIDERSPKKWVIADCTYKTI